jgi:hypothetical protein
VNMAIMSNGCASLRRLRLSRGRNFKLSDRVEATHKVATERNFLPHEEGPGQHIVRKDF